MVDARVFVLFESGQVFLSEVHHFERCPSSKWVIERRFRERGWMVSWGRMGFELKTRNQLLFSKI